MPTTATSKTVEAIEKEMAQLRVEGRGKDAVSARFMLYHLKSELRLMAAAEKRMASQAADAEKRQAKRAARAAPKSL